MPNLRLSVIAATLMLLLLVVSDVGAEERLWAEGEYVVNSNHVVPILVNGVEGWTPSRTRPGDVVCIRESTVYLQQYKRLAFRGWADGSTDHCRRVDGNLTAIYDVEVLFQVYAEPRGLRRSEWVKAGTLVRLDYPEQVYEGGNVRYVFDSWSGGENPFQPNNTIYVSEPTRLEARYVREYYVDAVGARVNGTGWYREGEVAILAAPPVIQDSVGERLVFSMWESVGPTPAIIPNPGSPVMAIHVKAPYVLRSVYERQYWVEVRGPRGAVYNGWVKEGESVRITVERYINFGEDVRLRFSGWSLSELPQIPEITLQVHRPINLTANYVKQYFVEVDSPYGASGGGWYDEGSTAVIRANPNPPANILVNRILVGYSGDCGESCRLDDGVITMVVDSPKTVRAIYVTELNLTTMSLVTGIAGALVIAYILTSKRGKRSPEISAEKELLRKSRAAES